MGNAHVPPGCQRAPARRVEKLAECDATGVAGSTRGASPQFGAGCGFRGGPDTGFVAVLGDGPNPERTASFQDAPATTGKFGEVDVMHAGRQSDKGNDGCIYHCGFPARPENIGFLGIDGREGALDCPGVPVAEASLDGTGAATAQLLGCVRKVPEAPAAALQDRGIDCLPDARACAGERTSRAKFESWDFPFEAQPTLMLARFKALPTCGRRPQAPGDKVVDDDDDNLSWLAAMLGEEAPCAVITMVGLDCCSLSREALAGPRMPLQKLTDESCCQIAISPRNTG